MRACTPRTTIRFAGTPGLYIRRGLVFLVALAAILLVPFQSIHAATIFVTESIDAIPAPEGSLRWAMEISESNGEPDLIQVLIDVDRITLVAPLPDLAEGGLRIGVPPDLHEPLAFPGTLILDGDGSVHRALTIVSSGNVLADFGFEGFIGSEILLFRGSEAAGNLIAGCGFQGPADTTPTPVSGIRIITNGADLPLPRQNVIRNSIFDGLDRGVRIQGSNAPSSEPANRVTADVHRNWFGLNPSGEPTGLGNQRAIEARLAGRIAIRDNRIAGPGDGILIDESDRSLIGGNEVGVIRNLEPACDGVDGPGIELLGGVNATIEGNNVLCSQVGILIGAGAENSVVRDNRLGSLRPGAGNLEQGLRIEDSSGSRVRSNLVEGNGGDGVLISHPGAPGIALSCNRIVGNAGAPIFAPEVTTLPPLLTGADPLSVSGELPDITPGWLELFGDDGDGPAEFQGSLEIADDQFLFTHRLPVLDMSVGKGALDPAPAEIAFATVDPGSHVATVTGKPGEETSETSNLVPSSSAGLVFDLIRGRLDALAPGPGGGVDLGPVQCLASGITGADLPVMDGEVPSPGEGFFYVSRRRVLLSNDTGTYDPAVCWMDSRSFNGPRRPSDGDCLP